MTVSLLTAWREAATVVDGFVELYPGGPWVEPDFAEQFDTNSRRGRIGSAGPGPRQLTHAEDVRIGIAWSEAA